MKKLYRLTPKVFSALLLCALTIMSYKAFSQNVNVTSTTGTSTSATYANINAAFAAVNAGTHTGVINMTIVANCVEPLVPTSLVASGTGSASYTQITIMPSGNKTVTSNWANGGSGSANRGILELFGAQHVTINGDDPATPGSQNLTFIANTTTTANVSVIRLGSTNTTGTGGASYDTVENCIITGPRSSAVATTTSSGILVAGNSTTTAQSTSANYATACSYNTFMNNTITRCYAAIWIQGSSSVTNSLTYANQYYTIMNDTLGSGQGVTRSGVTGSAANSVIYGIYAYYVNYNISYAYFGVIAGNDIANQSTASSSPAYYNYCIYDYYGGGQDIYNNNIHDISVSYASGYNYGYYIYDYNPNTRINFHDNKLQNTNNAYYTYGMYVYAGNTYDTVIFYNNVIQNINTQAVNGLAAYNGVGANTGYLYGFYSIGGTNTGDYANVYNNKITNVATTGGYGMYCYTGDFHDNTIDNIQATGTGSWYGIYAPGYVSNIYRNKINNIHGTGANAIYGAYIYGSNAAGTKLYNNFISKLSAKTTSTTATTTSVIGIYIGSTSTYLSVYNNTVALDTAMTGATTNWFSAGVYNSGYAPLLYENNIIYNNHASTNAFGYYVANAANVGTTAAKNCYYVPNGVLGGTLAVPYNTITAWQAATGKEAGSISAAISFKSLSDLHIDSTNANTAGLYSAGATISGLTTDIDQNPRPTPPSMGAAEFQVPPCAGPLGLTVTNNTGTSATISWNASIGSSTATGYNWEVRSSGAAGSGSTGLVSSGSTAAGVLTDVATGMSISSNYTLYVQTACGGPLSSWSSLSFNTNCNIPVSLALTGTSYSGGAWNASFSWAAPPLSVIPTGYNWEVRTSGAGGSGATGRFATGSTSASTLTATVTGLGATTTYSIYVQTNCGGTSSWAGPLTFTTLCNAITTYPVADNFESYGAGGYSTNIHPTCWSATEGTTGSSYHWTVTNSDATYGPSGAASGNGWMMLYVYLASTTYNPWYLTTVPMTLPSTPVQVAYSYWLGPAGYTTSPVPLTFQISTNSGSTWTNLYAHTSANSTIGAWDRNTISLAAYANQTVLFRWVSQSNYGTGSVDQGIDSFIVNTAPPALSITSSSAVCGNTALQLNVTSTLSNYSTYVWTPIAGLYQDAAATIPYTGGNLSTVYALPNGNTTYTCTAGFTPPYGSTQYNSASTTISAMGATAVGTNPITCAANGFITYTAGSGTSYTSVYNNPLTSNIGAASLYGGYALNTGSGAPLTLNSFPAVVRTTNTANYLPACLQLTSDSLYQAGALVVGQGQNPNVMHTEFDLYTNDYNGCLGYSSTPAGTGFSFTFGRNTAPAGNAWDNGAGYGLKLCFNADYTSYPTAGGGWLSNGTATGGVYLQYGNSYTTATAAGVLAYSSNIAWHGGTYCNSTVSSHVIVDVDGSGKCTVTVGGVVIMNKVQLPNTWNLDNKSTWVYTLAARNTNLGFAFGVGNLNIQQGNMDFGYGTTTASNTSTYQSHRVLGNIGAGTYGLWVRDPSNPSCETNVGTVVLTNPVVPGTVTPPSTSYCAGTTVQINAALSNGILDTLFRENFNAGLNGFTYTNSTASAGDYWHAVANPYTSSTLGSYAGPAGSQFAVADAYNAGSTTVFNNTTTTMVSPAIPVNSGLADTIKFSHYYVYTTGDITAKLEISTNGGSTWSTLKDYMALAVSQGTTTAAAQEAIDITSYVNTAASGIGSIKVRFNYSTLPSSTAKGVWAIDNVIVTAKRTVSATWSPASGLWTNSAGTTAYTSGSSQLTVYANAANTYTATIASDQSGCSANSSSVITVSTGAPTLAMSTGISSSAFLCQTKNDTITCTVTGGCTPYTYAWSAGTPSNAGNKSTIIVSPTTNTTYIVTVTDNNGSTVTASMAVTVSPITASINQPNVSVCGGAPALMSATTTNATSVTWSPLIRLYTNSTATTGYTGTNINTVYASVSTPSTFTMTATNSQGCKITDTRTVGIVINALGVTAAASPSVVCPSYPSTLSAAVSSGTGIVGTMAGFTGSSYVGPYSYSGYSNKIQYIMTATELATAGFVAGNISNIALYLVSPGAGTWNNFTIQMGLTSTATAGTTFITTPATTVYGPTTEVISGSTPVGWHTYTFSSPFYWDGTSNVFVSMCSDYNASNTSTTVACTYTYPTYLDNYYYSSPTSICATATAYQGSYRPNTLVGGTIPSLSYAWSTGATTTTITVNPASTTVYSLTATSIAGCITTVTDTVTVSSSAFTLGAITGPTTAQCYSSASVLTAHPSGGCLPYTYNWSTGINGNTLQTDTVIAATTSTYTVTVTDAAGTSATAAYTITAVIPQVLSTSATSSCGSGVDILTATVTPGASTSWYTTTSSGSIPIATTSNDTTPLLYTSTPYYVQAATGSASSFVGEVGDISGNLYSYTAYGMYFKTTTQAIINSVDIYPIAGTLTLVLKDAAGTTQATTSQTFTTTSTTTTVRMPLGWTVPAGSTGWQIYISSGNLYRGQGTYFYPYNCNGGLFTISGNTLDGNNITGGTRFYMYNWNVSNVNGCTSPFTTVVAPVTTPPTVTVSPTSGVVCSGTTAINVTSTLSNYNQYTWTPATGLYQDAAGTIPYVSGSSATTVYAAPTASTSYVVNALQTSGGGCNTKANSVLVRLTGKANGVDPTTCGSTGAINFTSSSGSGDPVIYQSNFAGNTLGIATAKSGWGGSSTLTTNWPTVIVGGKLQLTADSASQRGYLQVPQSLNPTSFHAEYDMTIATGSGYADGMSFSFGDNTGLNTNGNFEDGIGYGLKIAFDSYANGTSGDWQSSSYNYAGIYLQYGNAYTGATGVGVLAYNSTVSWYGSNTTTHITIDVDTTGKLTLQLGQNTIFNNVQLPAAWLTDFKSNWSYWFAARTGSVTEGHYVNNIFITSKGIPTSPQFSINGGTTWQNSRNFNNLSAGVYPLAVRDVTNPTCVTYAGYDTLHNPAPPAQPTIAASINGAICANTTLMLHDTTPVFLNGNIYLNDFNSGLNGFTVTDSSTPAGSGNPFHAQTAPYNGSLSNYSIDGTNFVISVPDGTSSTITTRTTLVSPPISLVNALSATLTFDQYLFSSTTYDSAAIVEITTNGGTTWTTLVNYLGTTQGSSTASSTASFNLSAYLGQTVQVRFHYNSRWGFYWAIDNFKIAGLVKQHMAFTWGQTGTPSTIYTDAATTLPYSSSVTTNTQTIYVRSSTPTIYTAYVTDSVTGCSSLPRYDTIGIIARPTSNINGATSACLGVAETYSVAFTGVAPWTYTIDTVGGPVIHGTTSTNTIFFTLRPYTNKTIRVTALSDFNCTGQYADLDTQNVVVTSGCSITWVGTSDTSWHNPNNWSPQLVPNACSVDITIPSGTPNRPVISQRDIQVGNITMGDNQRIKLNGHSLSICKNYTGPTTAVKAFQMTGTGRVIFNGSSSQTFTGYGNIDEMELNNASGLSLSNAAFNHISIYRGLHLHSGNLSVAVHAAVILLSTSVDTVAWLNDFASGYTGTYTGSLTVQRKVANTGSAWQHQMAAPVSGPNAIFASIGQSTYGWHGVSPLIPSSNCSEDSLNYRSPYSTGLTWHENNVIGAHDTCATRGWYTVNGYDQWAVGTGYSLYLQSNSTMTVLGTPNTGNISVSGLTNSGWSTVSPEGHPFNSGWSLIGNPYPSSLDMSGSRNANGFDNQIQVFIPTGSYKGTYQPRLLGVSGNPVKLSAFQGFMVHKTAVGGTSTFPIYQSERTTTQDTAHRFHKTGIENSLAVNVSGNGYNDVTHVEFNNNATDAFDPEFDANKFPSLNGQPTLYTTPTGNSNEWMSINTLGTFAKSAVVPMGFAAGVDGNYTFTVSVADLATFDASINIYLEDKQNPNNWINLRNNNSYAFAARSTDNWNRFLLHFEKSAAAGVTEVVANNNLNIFSTDNRVLVDFTKLKNVDATIQIFNILGQELSNETHRSSDTYVKAIENVDAAYVIVKVKMSDGSIVGKKLFIVNK